MFSLIFRKLVTLQEIEFVGSHDVVINESELYDLKADIEAMDEKPAKRGLAHSPEPSKKRATNEVRGGFKSTGRLFQSALTAAISQPPATVRRSPTREPQQVPAIGSRDLARAVLLFGENIANAPASAPTNEPIPTAAAIPRNLGEITKINKLTAGKRNVKLVARVSKKKIYKYNAKGTGEAKQIFTMQLTDSSGTVHVVSFRNDIIEKFNAMLLDGVMYVVSRFRLQTAQQNVGHKLEIMLEKDSVFTQYDGLEYRNAPVTSLALRSFETIHEMERGNYVDLAGFCNYIDDLEERMSEGTPRKYGTITLIDPQETSMRIALWDSTAEDFNGNINDFIFIKNCCFFPDGAENSLLNRISLSKYSVMEINPTNSVVRIKLSWFK